MFEYLRSEDNNILIFDTDDFSVESLSKADIDKCILLNIKIKGIASGGKIRPTDKHLIFNDNKYAFLNSEVEVYDYQNNIEVFALHGSTPSYSVGYNIWISRGVDKIVPRIVKHDNGLYEISLFSDKIGFSICLLDIGNGIIKPVYRDSKYVDRNSKLIISKKTGCFDIHRR